MIRRGTRIAAAALATAALAPWPASADPLAEIDRLTAAAEQRLAVVERLGAGPEETPAFRASRKFEQGEAQYGLGDWLHASILLTDAVDEPSFRGTARHPEAVFLLADALRRLGTCGAARPRFAEYLALGVPDRRADAVTGALECAVKEQRSGDVETLVREADRTFGANTPPEVRYLAAKALFQRTDLLPKERIERATAAFERVGPPYQLQAWYFLGVLQIQQQNLHGSLQWFESCAREKPDGPRQAHVRELCMLALGRVHTQMGDVSAALGWYSAVPYESPRFVEALYELATSFVKTQQYEAALRTASFIPELAPDSPLAPEARVLEGHLLLRLGRYAEATDAYNNVINAYAPVRDELDAILAMQEDPVRYFNELVGRQGEAFDVATVLPAVAVKWASSGGEVAAAIELVGALDSARRDLAASQDDAERVEALLRSGGGLDAFPLLQRAFASAQAVENDAAKLEGELVAAQSAAAERALSPERRARLLEARAARVALEARALSMPRTQEAVDARLLKIRARVAQVDRAAFQAGYLVDSLQVGIGGIESWVEQHRAEIDADPDGRRELKEELRKHREVADGYAAELRTLRREIAHVRDAAGGADAITEESRLRAAWLAATDTEREIADGARGALPGPEREVFERGDAVRERLASVRSRARALELGWVSEASRRAGELRDRVAAERVALATHRGTLDGLQSVSKDLVGRIAYRSFADVRAQFYKIVLKADVGIVDVAWSRKRVRLEKIQQLSIQKANEIEALDREYKALLREVD